MAGFVKGTTKHCCIQNIEALGLVGLEKKIFLCFKIFETFKWETPRMTACGLRIFVRNTDVMAEWLRRWTRNPVGYSRAGSNLARSVTFC